MGIEAETAGLLVASLAKVQTASGEASPAADAGVLPGDIIVRLGGEEIGGVEDFTEALGSLDGGEVQLTVLRDEKRVQLALTPVQDSQGAWRLGLWLRGSVSGIGTVTYYDPETGEYGALGHSITDADTGVLLPIGEGSHLRRDGIRRAPRRARQGRRAARQLRRRQLHRQRGREHGARHFRPQRRALTARPCPRRRPGR